MTENKRFVTIENGIDYGVIDTLTGERIFDEDITTKLNEIYVKVKESYNFGVDTKAKQLYTKTTVDDIMGIVKTNTPTDSVALKKEAQLSICEKRLIELENENEQLKKVLGAILVEVKQDISNTNQTGEIRVFINPHSFDLISEVLRKYGALKGWYE